MFNIFDYFMGEENGWSSNLTHTDTPPVELFKQYFAEDNYNLESKTPVELLKLDIEISSLFDSGGHDSEEDIKYVAKFMSNFCNTSKNYNSLSKIGKEKIDSIFLGKQSAVLKAIEKSGC